MKPDHSRNPRASEDRRSSTQARTKTHSIPHVTCCVRLLPLPLFAVLAAAHLPIFQDSILLRGGHRHRELRGRLQHGLPGYRLRQGAGRRHGFLYSGVNLCDVYAMVRDSSIGVDRAIRQTVDRASAVSRSERKNRKHGTYLCIDTARCARFSQSARLCVVLSACLSVCLPACLCFLVFGWHVFGSCVSELDISAHLGCIVRCPYSWS